MSVEHQMFEEDMREITESANARINAFDPFWPDWSKAPPEYVWHAVDEDGKGHFFPDVVLSIVEPNSDPGVWYISRRTFDQDQPFEGDTFDLNFLDWRNSLRHRPDEADDESVQ